MLSEQTAQMFATCNGCGTVRIFDLGRVMTGADMLRIHGYLNDLRSCPCEDCGRTRWAASVRFGELCARPAVHDRLAATQMILH